MARRASPRFYVVLKTLTSECGEPIFRGTPVKVWDDNFSIYSIVYSPNGSSQKAGYWQFKSDWGFHVCPKCLGGLTEASFTFYVIRKAWIVVAEDCDKIVKGSLLTLRKVMQSRETPSHALADADELLNLIPSDHRSACGYNSLHFALFQKNRDGKFAFLCK